MRTEAQMYMSRKCNITTDDKLWCVVGYYADGTGGGVLAWCYDKEDAIEATMALWDTGKFINLNYHKYQ